MNSAPGKAGEVAVAGAVDVTAGLELVNAGFVGGGDAAELPAFGFGIGDDGVEQHLHAGGPDELVEHQLEVFRVERDVAVRNFRAFQTGELPGGAPHDFRADSAVEQPLAVGKGAPGADQPGSAHAAEAAGVFDQQRVGSAARGGDGGGDSGRPPPATIRS